MTTSLRMAIASLDPYKLTGVLVTDHMLGMGATALVLELEYMGHKCAGKRILERFLKLGGSNYRNAMRRFSKECHFLSGIHHPNFVQFLGVYFQEPEVRLPILVMEFLPIDLTACINYHGILPEGICYSVLYDIAQGVLFLHDRTSPIIHRDLSSNNILLTPTLTAKIADLGVARIVNMSPLQVSALSRDPGTPAYMPPEVMVENPHYNTSVDEFSYGILMIQIFCGKSPNPHIGPTRIESSGLVAVSEAKRRQKYLEVVGQNHPLMSLILKCIDNNPKSRPSAKEIVEQIKEKAETVTASFKDRVERMKFVAEREAEKRQKEELERNLKLKEEQDEILKLQKLLERRKTTSHVPVILALLVTGMCVSIFIAYYTSTYELHHHEQRGLGEQANNFINSTFSECTIKETIKCDKLVPTMIHDLLGNISWKSGESLKTTLFQGQSVVVGDKMYYGGGVADDEVHKYIVYCYHPKLDIWTKVSGLPVKSFGLGVFKGELVVVGGITMGGEKSKKVYTYDERANSWISVIPDMPTSRVYPAVLSLPSALVIAGGENSIGIYTEEAGWYWSNQPLTSSCTDVTLAVAGSNCYVLAGNHTKELLQSDWFPLSQYVSTDHLLYDRNKVLIGTAYENRNLLLYPNISWKQLEGGFSAQANTLIGTAFVSNLVTVGRRSQSWNSTVRMYSLTQKTWVQIGELPSDLLVGSATLTSLSSTHLLVTGRKQDGVLSIYIGSL